jgi:hypothetical protein
MHIVCSMDKFNEGTYSQRYKMRKIKMAFVHQ